MDRWDLIGQSKSTGDPDILAGAVTHHTPNQTPKTQVGAKYNFDPSNLREMEAEVAALRSEDADLSPKGRSAES